MALEHILSAIEEQSNDAVRAALAKGESELDAARAQYARKLEQMEETMLLNARNEIAREAEHHRVIAELEARKKLLAEKRRILQELYDSFRKEVQEWDEKKRIDIHSRIALGLMNNNAMTLAVSPRSDIAYARNLLKAMNASGKISSGSVSFAEDDRLPPGNMALRKGPVEIQIAWPAILARLYEICEDRLTEALFG